MKFLFIMNLLSFGFQSTGELPEIGSSVKGMLSTYASEIKNCDVDELNIGSLSDMKGICQSLMNSKVCSDINSIYLVDCNNLAVNDSKINLQEDSLMKQCDSPGFLSRLKNAGNTIMRVIAYGSYSKDEREKWTAEFEDSAKSFTNYYKAEADRLGIEDDSLLGWSVLERLFKPELFGPEYGCLNEHGRKKVLCYSVVGIFGSLSIYNTGRALGPLDLGVFDGLGFSGAVVGMDVLPKEAMESVRKKNSLTNSSSNFSINPLSSSSDTSSSSAGE